MVIVRGMMISAHALAEIKHINRAKAITFFMGILLSILKHANKVFDTAFGYPSLCMLKVEGDLRMVNFGERLRLLRQAKGLTQQQLALQIGVSKSMVSFYESGYRYPSYEALIKIASVFSTTTDSLLGVGHHELLDISGLSEADQQLLVSLVNRLKK